MGIVNVNYGHEGSGKLYSYYDPKGNHRTGDTVVVPVTHKDSKKNYKTLAVIRSTHSDGSAGDKKNREFLQKENIGLKSISSGVSQKTLPGYYAGWAEDAKARKQLQYEYATLPGMTMDNFKNVYNLIRRL